MKKNISKLCLKENTSYTVVKDDVTQRYTVVGNGLGIQKHSITIDQLNLLKDLSLNTISSLNDKLNITWKKHEDVDTNSIAKEKVIEFTGTNNFQVNNFVGTIRLKDNDQGELIIEIGTRFDEEGQYMFLMCMLESWFHGGIGKTPSVPQDKSNMLDLLLMHVFANRMKLAVKKGVFKIYQQKKYNDYSLKGNIDFDRHLKSNTPFIGKIAYSKREHSYDNPIMWLVIHAYRIIKSRYTTTWNSLYERDITIREGIKVITENAPSYSSSMNFLTNQDVHKKITHPYFKEYEELRKTSLAIIKRDALSIYGNDYQDVNSVLVYIPRLWECFLKNEVFDKIDHKRYQTVSEQYQKTVMKKHGNNQKIVHFYKNYLDFFVETKDKRFVFDAKYSRKWNDQKYSKDAIRQVVNYVHLTNANACGIIAPDDTDSDHNKWCINDVASTPFYVLKLKVPKYSEKQKYQTFKEELKASCSELVKTLETVIR